jgi:hypothetical protein
MSDISNQVTEGILNAIGIIGVGAVALYLFTTLWWAIIPLALLAGVCYGLYRFTRKRPLISIWAVYSIVVCAIWRGFGDITLFLTALLIVFIPGGVAIYLTLQHFNEGANHNSASPAVRAVKDAAICAEVAAIQPLKLTTFAWIAIAGIAVLIVVGTILKGAK